VRTDDSSVAGAAKTGSRHVGIVDVVDIGSQPVADAVTGCRAGRLSPMSAEPPASRGATVAPSPWNVPNALTGLRILLVPVLGVLLVSDGGSDNGLRLWSFVVFTIAILTDRFDGSLARDRGLVTDLGAVLDPIADKALTGMAFIGLSLIGELWWWVTVVVLAREWFITGLRFWVIRYGVIPASKGGKIKTTLQAFALMGLILPLRQLHGGGHDIGVVCWWVAVVLMAAAVTVTVVTGLDYIGRAWRLRSRGRTARRSA
jgi:CDP-diacylglycerol--glycerol-3-phosphate 3-phosphatidyltransferase